LGLLDDNVAEAEALEFASELVDLAEGVDDPALAEFAVDGFLWAAQLAGAEEAVGDDDAAAGTEETVGFLKKRGFVRAVGVATALNCADRVEGFGGLGGVFVVTEGEGDVAAFEGGLVELAALLKLPRDKRDAVEVGLWKIAGEAA
jgi:hypothetical protein